MPSGLPATMRCNPSRTLSEPGLGPSVSPWSNAAMKDRPLSRSKSWPRRISAPFTIERSPATRGSGSPRRTIKRSPLPGLTPPVGCDFAADHRPAVHERQYPINRRPAAFGPLLECRRDAERDDYPGENARHPRASGDRACRSRAPSGAVRVASSPRRLAEVNSRARRRRLRAPRLAACPVRLL